MASKVFIHFEATAWIDLKGHHPGFIHFWSKRESAGQKKTVLSMAAANKYDFKMREVYDDIEQSDEACVLSGRSDYKPPPPATYEESTRDTRHLLNIRIPHVNRTRKSRTRHNRKDINYELKRFGNFRRQDPPPEGAQEPAQNPAADPVPLEGPEPPSGGGKAIDPGAGEAAEEPTTLPVCVDEHQTNCEGITHTQHTGIGTPPQQRGNRVTNPLHFYTTKVFKLTRTTPFRLSFNEECDYLAYYCMKAYQTGRLCARTFYYIYHTFINYCMLDYVNCRERHEIWQVIHMGDCFTVKPLASYSQYPYHNDYFLDQYYIVEENSLLV